MMRSRSLAPFLVAAVVLTAGAIILLTRSPETRSPPNGGIRVVANNGSTSNADFILTTSGIEASRLQPKPAPTATTAPTSSALPADLDASERTAMMPRQFRSEPRDASWGPFAEKTLQHAYAGIPYLASDAPMSVRCATTICEISGGIDSTATLDNQNIAMQQLQTQRNTQGFSDRSAMFGPLPGQPKGNGYRLYFKRR